MGWSDETEMLARLYALVYEGFFHQRLSWESCLPIKYRATAMYSIVRQQTQEDVRGLSAQLDAFVAQWKKNQNGQQQSQ
jgi:hypothetical protein